MKVYEDELYNIVTIGDGNNIEKKTELHVNNSIKLVSGDPNSEEFHSLQIGYQEGKWTFRTEYKEKSSGNLDSCMLYLDEKTGEWDKFC